MLKRYLFMVFLVLVFTSGRNSAQFNFHSAGVNIGWYNPSMDYWNESSTFSLGEEEFGGAFTAGVNLQYSVIYPLHVRLEGSYWSDSIERTNFETGTGILSKKLSVRFIGISGSVISDIPFLTFPFLGTYAGAGGGYYFIHTESDQKLIDGSGTELTNDGQDYIWHFLLGVEKSFLDYFAAGLEFRYNLGNYTQEVRDGLGNIIDEEVSLNGPKITLNLNYIF